MNLITCNNWTEFELNERQRFEFAPTNDPRVVAVIQHDDDQQISQLYDGDAINPILYVSSNGWGRTFEWVAGYDGGEAATITAAFERFGHQTARRYLWIFHGIACEDVSGGYDRDGSWLVVTSRAYREHVGVTDEPATYDEAREDCKAIAQDLEWALDGYVYGIGYATLEGRRLPDDEPIDLTDWEINIECWGFVGEEYAKREASGFEYGKPSLPELLELVTA